MAEPRAVSTAVSPRFLPLESRGSSGPPLPGLDGGTQRPGPPHLPGSPRRTRGRRFMADPRLAPPRPATDLPRGRALSPSLFNGMEIAFVTCPSNAGVEKNEEVEG